MWILNQTNHIAKRVSNACDFDIASNIPNRLAGFRSSFTHPRIGLVDIRHAPVSNRVVAHVYATHIRVEPQLEAADLKADVERPIEVSATPKAFVYQSFAFEMFGAW
jgi:hypothetical protein